MLIQYNLSLTNIVVYRTGCCRHAVDNSFPGRLQYFSQYQLNVFTQSMNESWWKQNSLKSKLTVLYYSMTVRSLVSIML